MRAYLIALLLVVAPAVVAAPDIQAPCGTQGQTKVFGCMDIPAPHAVLSQSEPIAIHGWALSCYSAQQPSIVEVFYAGHDLNQFGQRPLVKLAPTDFDISWRGYRPDVAAYFSRTCNLTSTLWGYLVVIKAGVLPPGETGLAVRFTDPHTGVGVNIQQVSISVQ